MSPTAIRSASPRLKDKGSIGTQAGTSKRKKKVAAASDDETSDISKPKSDPQLKELLNSIESIRRSQEQKKKELEEKKNFKKNVYTRTVRVVAKPQVSMMALALRQWFIKSMKRALTEGDIKSKYLFKFEIVDVISPNSFVIKPKTRSVLSEAQMHEKFMFKQLHKKSVVMFCGTEYPTAG